jgi:hypothetical protein
LETVRGAQGCIRATRRSGPRLGIAAVRRNESKPRPAAKSPLLDAIARAAVKRADAESQRSGLLAGRDCAAFPQVFSSYAQASRGRKKFSLARKAGNPVCEHPLSPKHLRQNDPFLLIGCAIGLPLWISPGLLARLQPIEFRWLALAAILEAKSLVGWSAKISAEEKSSPPNFD